MHRSGTPTTARRAAGLVAGVVAGLLVVLGLGAPAVATASPGASSTTGQQAGSARGATAEHASTGHVAVAAGSHRKTPPVPGGAAPVDGADVTPPQLGPVPAAVRPSAPHASGVDRTAHGRAPPA